MAASSNSPLRAEAEETYHYRTARGVRTYIRQPGELLHPVRESESALQTIRAALGSHFYAAQYQQQPMLPDGNLINASAGSPLPEPPSAFDLVFQSWDTASKAGMEF